MLECCGNRGRKLRRNLRRHFWRRDRVAARRHASIYEAQGYRHLVSSTLITRVAGDSVEAVSNYQVARIMRDGATTLFATGRYLDRIALDGEARFEDNLVVLDSRRVDPLPALPL